MSRPPERSMHSPEKQRKAVNIALGRRVGHEKSQVFWATVDGFRIGDFL